jgi:hypothetical protein
MEFEFNPEVPSIEAVPEDFRGLYHREGDAGPYKLREDDHSKSAVRAITGLNTSLKAARRERDEFKGRIVDLSPLKEFGETPDKIKAGIEARINEAKRGQTGKPTSEQLQEAVNAARGEMTQAHEAQVGVLNKRVEALTGQLHETLVSNEITTALAAAKAINPDLMMPYVQRHVAVKEEEGKFVVSVQDKEGNIRFSPTTGKALTIKELVSEMRGKEEFGSFFGSDKSSGGGTPPGGRRSAPASGEKKTAMDKIKAGIEARRGR